MAGDPYCPQHGHGVCWHPRIDDTGFTSLGDPPKYIESLQRTLADMRRERDNAISDAAEYKRAYETCHKNACEAIAALEKIVKLCGEHNPFDPPTDVEQRVINLAQQIIERSKG